jgi:hypothetical protein
LGHCRSGGRWRSGYLLRAPPERPRDNTADKRDEVASFRANLVNDKACQSPALRVIGRTLSWVRWCALASHSLTTLQSSIRSGADV